MLAQPHHPPAISDEDLTAAEAEMIRQEQKLEGEIARLKNLRREAQERVTEGQVDLKVPSLSVRTQLDEARLARLKALGVRKACSETALKALRAHEAELDGVFDQVKRAVDAAKRAKQAADEKAKEQARKAQEEAVSLEATMIRAIETHAIEPQPAPTVDDRRPPQQRRAAPRVALCAEISLGSDHNFFTGFTNDISDGGVFVATVNLMPIGTQVDLAFSLPGGPRIEGKGEVRWVREFDDRNPDAFPGMGIRFTDLPLPDVTAIHGFTQQREPMFFPEH